MGPRQKTLIEYLQMDMLTHVYATTDFTDKGSKTSLQRAFDIIVKDTTSLYRQPNIFVILRFVSNLSKPVVQQIIGQIYLRLLVSRYLQLIIPNGSAEENLAKNASVLRQLFDALYKCAGTGIPQMNSGRVISVDSEIMTSLVPFCLQTHIDADYERIQKLYDLDDK